MTRVTPEQFAAAFLRAATASQAEILERWNGPRRDYTSLIFANVLPAIATPLGIECYNGDYYGLAAPRSAVAELEVVRRRYARCVQQYFSPGLI